MEWPDYPTLKKPADVADMGASHPHPTDGGAFAPGAKPPRLERPKKMPTGNGRTVVTQEFNLKPFSLTPFPLKVPDDEIDEIMDMDMEDDDDDDPPAPPPPPSSSKVTETLVEAEEIHLTKKLVAWSCSCSAFANRSNITITGPESFLVNFEKNNNGQH